MTWLPDPKPDAFLSVRARYKIRRTALGYAIYDHALGIKVKEFLTLDEAVRLKRFKKDRIKKLRRHMREAAE